MAQNNGHSDSTENGSKIWTTTTHRPTVAQRLLHMTVQQPHDKNKSNNKQIASQSDIPDAAKSQPSLNTQKVEKNQEQKGVCRAKEDKTEQRMKFPNNCGTACAGPGSKYIPPHRNPANYWSHPNYKVTGGLTTTYPFRSLPRRNNWEKCPEGTVVPCDVDSNWRRH